MQVKKAVITAAGRGVRLYPAADTVQRAMFPLIGRDGITKPVIQIIVEEALDSGIEEVCVVGAPGDADKYRAGFKALRENMVQAHQNVDWAREQAERLTNLLGRVEFAVQEEPLGYGHAVHCAGQFVGDQPFLLLLSDHLYISELEGKRCAQQLIELAGQEDCAVAAVQATREHLVGHYGTLRGKRVPNQPSVYQIERIIEKPSVSLAEMELQTPGLRVGHYLCFFGMYVLTPSVFDMLDPEIDQARGNGGSVQLTPALNELAERERYLALEVQGRRYDVGARFGLLRAQIALAMAGQLRDEVLATMVEAMAESSRSQEGR